MKFAISLILIFLSFNSFSLNKKKQHIISTNILPYSKTRPNLYVERINLLKNKGIEFGIQFNSPLNIENLSMNAFGYFPTWLDGNKLIYSNFISAHHGIKLISKFKLYNKNMKGFFATSLSYSYKQLLNKTYGHIEFQGPASSQIVNTFHASHYSNSINVSLQKGFLFNKKNKNWRTELGFGIGSTFFLDKLEIQYWGNSNGAVFNEPYNNFEYPKFTNGNFIRPNVQLFYKIGRILKTK